MLKIAIPKPCHEDWDKMSPNQQGRHCNACAKTVTDFTVMSDEAIKDFFINKKEEKVCGRFKNEQLSRIVIDLPGNIFYIDMPLWKKFLAACLIVFSTSLFSCDMTINGKKTDEQQILKTYERVHNKSNTDQQLYVGGITLHWDSIPILPVIYPVNCGVTYGFSTMIYVDSSNIAVDSSVAIVPDSTVTHILSDSSSIQTKNLPDSNMRLKPDSLKTKNPAKPDSLDCDQSIFTKL